MTSFVQIKEGDTVFDRIQQVSGVVTGINYKTNVAEITSQLPEVEIILCKLFNLTVVGKPLSPPNNDKHYAQVEVFHEAFDHPIAEKPTQMSLMRATSRSIWTGEEALVEFLHASSANEEEFESAYDKMIVGLQKAKKKSLAMDYYNDGTERIVAQSDALTDALYFIFGSFVEMGVKPDKLFDIVQESNMSKLFIDEKGNKFAKYRESDGKILKSDDFFPPEPALLAEIERQSKLK